MNVTRAVFRLLLGRRLPVTGGTLRVAGLDEPLTIHRDGWGIPHIEAGTDGDAAFGIGFCHAQDRAFQMETMLRAARGTIAAFSGDEGPAVKIDRLSRRIGFRRSAETQLEVIDGEVRAILEAYASGVNAGYESGLRRRPHEFALLRRDPTPWTATDSLAAGKLIGFGLATNWDMELARLKVLALDGPDALCAVDPAYPGWLAVTSPPGGTAGAALDRLAEEAGLLAGVAGGGGSNNWTLAPSRTASGRPVVANDPHLPPTLPAFWYLVDVRGASGSLVGASAVGLPSVAVGHNGTAAWGATNSGADVVDLYLEEVGEDGHSVRGPDGPQECEVREERIEVRGGDTIVERVLVTPRGPIISPALEGNQPAVSMRAVFLEPLPFGAIAQAPSVRSFDEFRASYEHWPVAPLNMVYADMSGRIGWQVVGQVPRRRRGSGLLPLPAWEDGGAWDGYVEYDDLPREQDPESGFVATANNKPVADGHGPWLGADWMDGYRVHRISEALAERSDWDVDSAMALQLDRASLPWRELRDTILGTDPGADARTRHALNLLEGWDGVVAADSAAASVFELFVAEMTVRALRAKAPRSLEWALGRGAGPLVTTTYVGLRHVGQMSKLLRDAPDGWFTGGWEAEVAVALATAVERLQRNHGADSAGWAWGRVRPITLRHPLGERRPLNRIFDIGPFEWGGDANTPAQASNSPTDPTGDPLFLGTLRMVIDVGEWENSRFVLAGGQSGNPLSPHYADQFEVWRRGEGIPIAHSPDSVRAATRATLRLQPV